MNIKKTQTFLKTAGLAMALSIAPAFTIATAPQAAGLQSQMDKMFGDMSNVTSPGAYKTQRRGVLTGGRITQKSKIFNENLVSFSPPSWKAGCGGVDMFGGALSFISKDQIVALMRAVAANAKGYFFQLALANTCPQCSTMIEAFQKKIQELNQFLGNSCQLAQGLVNDASNLLPFDVKHKTDASLTSSAKGFMSDMFESREQTTGKSATQTLKEKDPAAHKEMTGNITWKQLNENNAKNWFTMGDDLLMETVLSLVGSVVIGEPKSDGTGDDSTPVHFIPGNQVTLSEMMFGGQLSIYDCSADKQQCAGVNGVISKKKVNTDGLIKKIDEVIKGTPSSIGILEKYRNHKNHAALAETETKFMEVLPGGVGSTLRNLAALSPDAAEMFANEASAALALDMIYHLTDGMFRSATLALANSPSAHKSTAIEELAKSQRTIQQEYLALQRMYGSVSDLMGRGKVIIDAVRTQKYQTQMLSKPPKKSG